VPRRTTTHALLLRSVDFGESDKIVHLLTPGEGRLTAIAKGARRSVKRFPGTLDIFNHLRVQTYQSRPGRMVHLEQARLVSPFEHLRVSPCRFGLACYLVEMIDRIAPEGGSAPDCKRLFDFTLGALRVIGESEPDPRLRVLLELRALDAAGLRPELRLCLRCGQEPPPPGPVGFHVGDGGPVCNRCEEHSEPVLPVNLGTLRALHQSLCLPFDKLDRLAIGPQSLAEATRVVARFTRFHVGLELKSERFLDEVLSRGEVSRSS
jgi:DNA repair protein RecO (recombination protein O)